MDRFDDKWGERFARRQERMIRKNAMRMQQSSPMHGALVGGLIIAVGALFLLNNIGIIHVSNFWEYWPLILIVFGMARLVEARGPGAIIAGAIMAGIGALILAYNLRLIYFDWRMVWPVLLIAWGLIVLLHPKHRSVPVIPPGPVGGPGSFQDPGPAATPGPSPYSGSDASTIRLWTVFGGGKRQVDAQDFRGGEITAIFGGYEVDLRYAAVGPAPAVIDVTAMFGGIEIRVPGTWTVEARGVGIFGGFADETRPPRPGEVTREQRLIVTGTAAFGGVAIKN